MLPFEGALSLFGGARMLRSWRRWLQRKGRPAAAGRTRGRRLRLEALEDRAVPAFVQAPAYNVGPNSQQGSNPVAVAVGDFNRDGRLDVVTANQGSDTGTLLVGNGNGTFQPARNYAVGKGPVAVLAVDLNGDGLSDVVTANKDDNTVSVLLAVGNLTFWPALTYAAGSNPSALAYGDFNGDHKTDLAVADN